MALNESLSIVTGCIKSESWALAAYRDAMMPPHNTLQLVPISDYATGNDLVYVWTKRGTSETRAGDGTPGEKNQCLFVRGFRLNFSREFRILANESYSKLPGSGRGNGPTGGSEGEGPAGRSSQGGQGSHGGGDGTNHPSGLEFGGGARRGGGAFDVEYGVQVKAFPVDRPEVGNISLRLVGTLTVTTMKLSTFAFLLGLPPFRGHQ